RALAESRSPSRRIARASGPFVLSDLARGLDVRLPEGSGRARAWRGLADAIRICRWQAFGAVLAIDDADHLDPEADLLDLVQLAGLLPGVTVLIAGRPEGVLTPRLGWELAIRLSSLARGEAGDYLAAKLAAAGRPDSVFTRRAITRLHALTGGIPRGL